MRMEVVLTVSESKRLIAKAITAHPAVEDALRNGTVAVAKGTTNAYVAEELLGKSIDKHRYVSGWVQPATAKGTVKNDFPDVVLKNGKPLDGISAPEAARSMGPGDVFIKGANALNYASKVAGVLIGHPTGGDIGATIGHLVARRVRLIIPVGLEKNIATDIHAVHNLLSDEPSKEDVPTMWPVYGEIITEIEALNLLTDVQSAQIGSGGVNGAEGSVRILFWGDLQQIEITSQLIKTIQGEPRFM